MVSDTKKKRDYLERYECSEDVKRLDGGLNFANNFLVALTSIKEDPVPEKIGKEPGDFVVEGKTIIVNEPPVDDQPQFNLDVDENKEKHSESSTICSVKEEKPVLDGLAAFVSSYLDEHRHDVLLSPHNGLMEFAEEVVKWRENEMMKEVQNAIKHNFNPPTVPENVKKIDYEAYMSNHDLGNAVTDFYLAGGADSPFDSTGLVWVRKIAQFGADWQQRREEDDKALQHYYGPNEGAKITKSLSRTAMMTIEEKAKTYDEIIERAKTMLAAGEVMYGKENNARQLITDIIPELEDSEDERIREAIIGAISTATMDECTRRDCLAYLEKQKEQKLTWSEEDSIHLANAILSAEKEWGTESCTAKWLEFLPERFNLQPKQEWSEEDENNLNKLLQWDGIPLGLRRWVSGLPEKVGTRPSWKPSEEQMEVLRKYVMGEWKGLTFKEDEHLKSLLIDLENYSHDNR